jgi:hypothetical protein
VNGASCSAVAVTRNSALTGLVTAVAIEGEQHILTLADGDFLPAASGPVGF